MRATSVMRFILFGAVGFGIGWAVLGVLGGGFPIAGGVGTVLGGAIFSETFQPSSCTRLSLALAGRVEERYWGGPSRTTGE
jgi:hypothetical protein